MNRFIGCLTYAGMSKLSTKKASGFAAVFFLAAAAFAMTSMSAANAQVLAPSQLGQQSGSSVTINGAGATFPAPIINEWRLNYTKSNPSVNINYQPIGSGAGIKQLMAKTIDFGASDAPLSASQTSNFSAPVVHIPETIGSVVAAYNLPEFAHKGLNFTGAVLADIFQGKVKNWNDPEIKALNPTANLPNQPIVVVHRSDGSGTTFVWTSYLSKASTDWNTTVGHGTSVSWPTGLGENGNPGVANTVSSTPYAIGYVELAYALTSHLNYGFIKNAAGNFVEPTLNSTLAAVTAAATQLPAGNESWAHVSLLNATGSDSYPIATFTYLLVYKDMSTNINSIDKAKAVANFIQWIITNGQQISQTLSYVPLPSGVVQVDNATLHSLTYKGQPVLG